MVNVDIAHHKPEKAFEKTLQRDVFNEDAKKLLTRDELVVLHFIILGIFRFILRISLM